VVTPASVRHNRGMTNPAEIMQAFKQAMKSGDVAGARKLVHDDMTFVGPFDKFDRPEPYFAALGKLASMVKSVTVHRMFAAGDDVCVLYDMETTAGTSFIAEWLQLRAGKIAAIRTVFDPRPFAAMFGK
jgi:hypothetical protein